MTSQVQRAASLRMALRTGAALAVLAAAGPIHAQQQTSVASGKPTQATLDAGSSVQEVIVTGTRRTDRTLTNSASPVDVLSGAEIAAQPAPNLIDQINNIVPSFFVGQNTISDASSFVRAPSLRGLPSDEVLIQLDGKRYNRSALVQVYTGGDTGLSFGSQGSDLNAIPAIAIGNVQILRDGATAQYGSDAIAGVINFGLRQDKGLELQAQYGRYYAGDGDTREISGDVGFGLGSRGFVNIAGEYDNDDGTSRGATRPIAVQFAQLFPDLKTQLPNYPKPVQLWGTSPSESYKLLFNSGYNVTDNSKLYFFFNYAHTNTNESFNYRSPISGTAVDEAGVTHNLGANGSFNPIYLTPCPAATPTCPAGGFVQDNNIFHLTSIYPAGFTPRFVGITEEIYGTAGYKGSLANGFTWDISGSLSRNSLGLSMYNSISPSYGPQSQTRFNFGDLIQEESVVNVDLTYPVKLAFLASPLTVAVGGEYRTETYTQTAGDPQSYGAGPYTTQPLYAPLANGTYVFTGNTASQSPGASGYGGTSPEAAGKFSQESYAFYADLEGDITQALSVGLAGRYEHYNTFGGDAVGKFNAIYKLSDALSVRATVGSGFHAPSPGQSNDEILTTNFIAGNQVQTGTYPVSTAIAQYYGAKTLKPETSVNFGAGFVYKPISNLVLTVDYYHINVSSRIGISQQFTVTQQDIINQPELINVGVGGNVNYFTNGFSTVTQGVDLVGSYSHPLYNGRLGVTLAYNFNYSSVSSYDPTVISHAQIVDISRLAPNHRVVLTGNYTQGPWTFNARENFYGPWRDEIDYPGQRFSAKFTTDLDISYTFREHYTLTLGALNVFNTKPDRIAQTSANPVYPVTGSLSDGEVYPRSGGPFGINGGYYYGRVRVKF